MTDSAVNMLALVEHLAKAVVESPDEVTVEAFEEGGQTVLELIVAETALGRVVDSPEEGRVEAFEEGGQTVLELIVAETDLGRVIGRQGRMARSLRMIVNAASLRTRKGYQLEIVE